MSFSLKEICALHNLADKRAGEEVGWVSIADARALTELGLAKRTRSGWEITPDGLALVKEQARPVEPAKLVNLR